MAQARHRLAGMSSAVAVPLVSIIVISKDDPVGLRRTLASIAEQKFDDLEVVVIAKGGSESVYVADWPYLSCRSMRQQSSGIANAFNEGIAAARGRWFNFLNGGDAYQHATVLHGLEATLRGTPALLVAGRARDARTGVMIPRDRSFRRRNLELVSHQASFFAATLFDRYGAYDAGYGIRMDFEWMLRLPRQIESVWVDDVLVSFEGQGVSSTGPWRSCMEELRAVQRHRPGVSRVARLLALYLPFRLARARWRKLWT